MTKRVNKIFELLAKANPEPTTELKYSSVFELLVAVILSAQATDKSVNIATEKLFKIANTPLAILNLGENKLKAMIKTIGLFNNKAKNIIATCEKLVSHYNSEVPNNLKDLESLPGVGRKTANVVLNTAFDHPSIAVDTHVHRVSNRLQLSKGKTPLQVESDLLKTIPKKYLKNAHHWLVLHGRYVCKARTPDCTNCILNSYCRYGKSKL